MSWSRALFLVVGLAACGFQPVYGPGGAGTQLQNAVLVAEPETREAFLVTRRIEERLGRSGDARYSLGLDVTTSVSGLAVDTDGTTSRSNLIGVARYSLIDTRTGAVVTSGAVDNFTAYSRTGTTVATRAASEDAEERLMTILADQIVTRLLALDLS